jgi:AhpD family alkylhydroperoxidase
VVTGDFDPLTTHSYRSRSASNEKNGRRYSVEARLDVQKIAPGAVQALLGVETYVRKAWHGEPLLLELIKMRASQINGCAYCIDMHSKDARAEGESEQRLYALSAWRETPFFTDRERAALAWTEAITLISQEHAPDRIYNDVRQHFTDQELVDLTMAIVAINGWNRMAIGFRALAGEYQPPVRKHADHA